MPKVLSSSAKLRLEKTRTSSSSSPPSPHARHVHQHQEQQQQHEKEKISSSSSSGMKKKRKKKPASQQPDQPQQHRQQPSPPRLSLPRASEAATTTTPQRQHRQVTAESSSLLPSSVRPPKKKQCALLEKAKSPSQNTSTSLEAAAAAAPPSPSPFAGQKGGRDQHVMQQKKRQLVATSAAAAEFVESSTSAVAAVSAGTRPLAGPTDSAKPAMIKKQKKRQIVAVAVAAATVESSSTVAAAAAVPTAAAAKDSTTTIKTKSLKRKRNVNPSTVASHPFRIKLKCVVALRMQPQGNHVVQIIQPQQQPERGQEQQQGESLEQQQQPVQVPIFPSPDLVHVWTNPLAGRDEGLALIGKRIRCFFPKSLIQQQQPGNNSNNTQATTAKQKQQRRVLEGEVVSVQASSSISTSKSKGGKNASSATTNTTIHHFPPWKVELLVDKTALDHFSFLIQTNIEPEPDTANSNDISNNSKTHRRNSRLEQVIRGENKVTVKMRLQNPSHDESSSSSNCVKWVIQKRVPAKLFKCPRRNVGTSTSNNNDSTDAIGAAQDNSTKLTKDGKVDHDDAAVGSCESHPNPNTAATTDTTILTDRSSSSSHSPLARTLNGTGNSKASKSNGVHNVPTAPTTVASSLAPPSPPPGEQQQRVKKRRKLSSTENNSINNNNNAVVIKHVGDGNDSADQQVANWRWLASRYHDYMLQQQSPNSSTCSRDDAQQLKSSSSLTSLSTAAAMAEILSAGLVGEVVKVEATSSLSKASSSSSSLPLSSLAFVTIRRLVLPELTASGRLPDHGIYDIFNLDDDINNNNDIDDCAESEPNERQQQQQQQPQFFRIPVEELVVISRTIQNEFTGTENQQQLELYRTHGYSPSQDKYTALEPSTTQSEIGAVVKDERMEMSETGNEQATLVCHSCRRLFRGAAEKSGVECTNADCPVTRRRQDSGSCNFWCNSCVQSFGRPILRNPNSAKGGALSSSSCLPCCARVCDCRDCRRWIGSYFHQDLYQSALDALTEIETGITSTSSSKNGVGGGFFSVAQSIIESVGPIDFGLPHDFLDLASLPAPAAKPMIRIKTRKAKQRKKAGGASGKKRSGTRSGGRDAEPTRQRRRREPEDYSVFKPTCARLLPYEEMKRLRREYEDSYEVPETAINTDRPRNLRLANKPDDDEEKDGNNNNSKTMESRAARVKQRRLLKSVAGIQSFEVDTLAGRESQLRFGRSGIHAWGVYADADITAGDMIVEYRGELIENAMAEKREKEYETAKIGSDYMFRIDQDTVCDATKVGNVARFINASCDPNCYTKIITVGSEKRIVIYAKRDISAGQELCYDYKFPLESDESKRIPCHCGARTCRGFMNWDKRYVAVPDTASSPEDERKPAASEPELQNFANKDAL